MENRENKNFETIEPPAGLFDRIILAIKKEQELKKARKILITFLLLLIVSSVAVPFSWKILVNQIESSGISYFVSVALSDFHTFFIFWKDFSLAILESLPITGIIIFALSLGIFLFTLRLFLYKKRTLIRYVMHFT